MEMGTICSPATSGELFERIRGSGSIHSGVRTLTSLSSETGVTLLPNSCHVKSFSAREESDLESIKHERPLGSKTCTGRKL